MIKCKIKYLNITYIALSAFLFAFTFGYIIPVFFAQGKLIIPTQIPTGGPFGSDLKWTIDMALDANKIPYSPFADILFSLFSHISFNFLYYALSITSFCILVVYSLSIMRSYPKNSATIILILITTLSSYGLLFEIERGQWNIIACLLIMLSIYYYKINKKLLAVILFSVAVHLKIYPIIFILVFSNNYNDVKGTIKFWIYIGVVNIALFFIEGWGASILYFKNMFLYAKNPAVWIGNHSIFSFSVLCKLHYSLNHKILFIALMCSFILMLSAMIFLHFKNRMSGINIHLILFLTLGAIMLPTVSHDYTLSLLTFPIVYFIAKLDNRTLKTFDKCWLFVLMFIFFISQYSYANFEYLNSLLVLNKLPLLFIISILVFISFYLKIINRKI